MFNERPSEALQCASICTTCRATALDVLSRMPTHTTDTARDDSTKATVDPQPPAPTTESRRGYCKGCAGHLTTRASGRTFRDPTPNTAPKPKAPPPVNTRKLPAFADERIWHVNPKTVPKPKHSPVTMNNVNTYGYGVIGRDPRAMQVEGKNEEFADLFKTAVNLRSVKGVPNPTKTAVEIRAVKEAPSPFMSAMELRATKEASIPFKTAVETRAVKQMPVVE